MRPGMTELGGMMMANTICEDVWVPELVAEAAEQGAEVVFNISASPFHAGKGAEREEMLAERARANGVWLAYCNLVGGQDELVFDGRSLIISPEGEVIARGRAFEEDLVVADITPGARLGASAGLAPEMTGAAEVYSAIELGLRDYAGKNGFTDVVIGLSGGIDSALTAAIAVDALGPEHVHGVMMPSRYSSAGSVSDSVELAAALGIEVRELSIEPGYQAALDTLSASFEGREDDVTEENLQARVRGMLLMALSNKFGWLVLATGNKSELSVGYSTLYGDMVGGFAPLKDVFKTRVYELARWRNAQAAAPVIPAGDHRQGTQRRAAPRPARPGLAAAVPGARRDPRALRGEGRQPRRDRGDGLPRSRGRPRHPAHRRRRVQAPAGASRREDHRQGVWARPSDAGHQPLRGLRRAWPSSSWRSSRTTGSASTRCSTSPTTCCTATSACREAATGISPHTAASSPSRWGRAALLLGTARLLPAPGDASRQVRQVAVSPDARVGGVGRALMGRLEAIALQEDAASSGCKRATTHGASTSVSATSPRATSSRAA